MRKLACAPVPGGFTVLTGLVSAAVLPELRTNRIAPPRIALTRFPEFKPPLKLRLSRCSQAPSPIAVPRFARQPVRRRVRLIVAPFCACWQEGSLPRLDTRSCAGSRIPAGFAVRLVGAELATVRLVTVRRGHGHPV